MTEREQEAGARRLSIFNHKGGVGKTTLTMNVGAALATMGNRVLLMDTDPQCNLTSYLVEGEVVDNLLDESDTPSGRTIWSAVRPVSEALGEVAYVEPIELNVDGLFLVPGDIRLSEFEGDLNDFWGLCLQRKARGFRGTAAISSLIDQLCGRFDFDYVLYDSGPNIGPLNRSILLDCDEFIVPVAADLFSLRALKTLGRTLVDWVTNWETIGGLAPADMPLLSGRPEFLGYIAEGFKTYGGSIAKNQAEFLADIDKEIYSQVVALLRSAGEDLVAERESWKLGELKNLGALVPESQQTGTPLFSVTAGSRDQQDAANDSLFSIASTIIEAKAD